MADPVLRLATRGSLLARTQSQQVADALMRAHGGLRVELVICTTSGDRITDRPLADAGGKGLFTKEIEEALLAGRADLAVHSFKDVPVTMPLVEQSNLVITAVPAREDPRDVLLLSRPAAERGAAHESGEAAMSLLRAGAVVGTGSLRRRCQALALRDDLEIRGIRGNIDTRIRKCRDGEYDAIILAMAGLKRAGLFDAATMVAFEVEQMLPAAGQGALALQCRADDSFTRQILMALDDPQTRACVEAERAVVAGLAGDCHSPIAAYAQMVGGEMSLRATVGARDGELPLIHAAATNAIPSTAVDSLLADLARQGAKALLHGG